MSSVDLTPFWPATDDWAGFLLLVVPAGIRMSPNELRRRVRHQIETDAVLYDLVTVALAPPFAPTLEWERDLCASLIEAAMPDRHFFAPRGLIGVVVASDQASDRDRAMEFLQGLPSMGLFETRIFGVIVRPDPHAVVSPAAVQKMANIANRLIEVYEQDPAAAVTESMFLEEVGYLIKHEGLVVPALVPPPQVEEPMPPALAPRPPLERPAPSARASASAVERDTRPVEQPAARPVEWHVPSVEQPAARPVEWHAPSVEQPAVRPVEQPAARAIGRAPFAPFAALASEAAAAREAPARPFGLPAQTGIAPTGIAPTGIEPTGIVPTGIAPASQHWPDTGTAADPLTPPPTPSRPLLEPVVYDGAEIVVVDQRTPKQRLLGRHPADADTMDDLARDGRAVGLVYLVFVPDDGSVAKGVAKGRNAIALELDQAFALVDLDMDTGKATHVAIEVFSATNPVRKHGILRQAGDLTESMIPSLPIEYFDTHEATDALLDAAARTTRALRARGVQVVSQHYVFIAAMRFPADETTEDDWMRLLNQARVTWIDFGTVDRREAYRMPASPFGLHVLSAKEDVVPVIKKQSEVLYGYIAPAPSVTPVRSQASESSPAAGTASQSRRWWRLGKRSS